MLIRQKTTVGKKNIYKSRPTLIHPRQAYTRPEIDFKTTTSIWNVDELIKRRIRDWRRLTGEDGHTGERAEKFRVDHHSVYTGTYSVFPIPLVEWILVRYGGEPGNKVLDAFAGGPSRAIASSIMGYEYHGFEVRDEQIWENYAITNELKLENINYYLSDGRWLDCNTDNFDVAVTCPPYHDLEQYSDQDDDISNLPTYASFNAAMWMSAHAHYERLKPGAFACIVVGNYRNKNTAELIDLRSHTVENFRDAGFLFWQEIILSKNFGSAAKRSTNAWKGHKLVPRHEFLLIFKKPGGE